MYLGIVVVLGLITGVAVQEAVSFEAAYELREHRGQEEVLLQVADRWEDNLAASLVPIYRQLAEVTDVAAFETRLRAESRAIDAVYLWDGDELTYPPAAVEEDLAALHRTPCIAAVDEQSVKRGSGPVDPVLLSDAYARCTKGAPAAVGLLAASLAAQLAMDAEQPGRAEQVIRQLGRVSAMPLAQSTVLGVDVRRVASVKLQRIRAMEALGSAAIVQQHLDSLADEITQLDGPRLERAIDLYEWPVAHDLRAAGGAQRGGDGDEALARAARRLAAWRELSAQDIDPRDVPALGEAPRVLVDRYAEPPWLVLLSRVGMGEMVAAVQIDQQELLREWMAHTVGPRAPFLSVRDAANNRVLVGSSEDLAAEVPFPRVLTHLRVGMGLSAVSTEAQTRRAFLGRLLPFGIAIGVGLMALYALIRTDRQQEMVLQRQRDFVARVSHELKTPLAGIRVMAETIEIGAVRDEAQRAQFARRIVTEAEKLTDRVNEVLRAAARPDDDVPVPVDIDALVTDLAAAWQPRFEQVGATLAVETVHVGRVVAMPVLLRDALTNLLDNAIKYRKAERGGRAWLRVSVDRRWLCFEVADDGMGVPAAHRKSIFDRFRRVEGSGRGKAGGHGLGLAFVAETARLHGGKAECLDGVEGGARFVLRIRRTPAPTDGAPRADGPRPS